MFVRVSNLVAIGMYKKFGYTVYRRVNGYYSSADNNEEDAFGMFFYNSCIISSFKRTFSVGRYEKTFTKRRKPRECD